MNTSDDVLHAYCTNCGARTVDGACSGHCQALEVPAVTPWLPGRQPTRPAPSSHSGRIFQGLTVAALLVSLTLGGVAVALLASTHARLDVTASALQRTQDLVTALGRQLGAAQSEQQAVAGRLTGLESDLNGQPDIPRTAKTASKSVFTIEVTDGSGSGFAVAHDAGRTILVTNFHVVARTYVNGAARSRCAALSSRTTAPSSTHRSRTTWPSSASGGGCRSSTL